MLCASRRINSVLISKKKQPCFFWDQTLSWLLSRMQHLQTLTPFCHSVSRHCRPQQNRQGKDFVKDKYRKGEKREVESKRRREVGMKQTRQSVRQTECV